MNRSLNRCPLCESNEAARFFTSREKAGSRDFHRCPVCDLVFVPERFHLDTAGQKARYLTHNNDPEDSRYRDFLSRLLDPLRPHLIPGSEGLDFGAGPGPALAVMMREEGFRVRLYDPFFHRNVAVLEQSYDFVACTETAEHFALPMQEFQTLDRILKPSGWLGVMTGMLESWNDFADWHYHRDTTHICFYSRRTMEWIAERFSWDVQFPSPNVVLFQKPVFS
jgi:2-polyprenyl-3-methyl-5-hydroxy-6-metoxy-1,4-benzoquinol methylase